MAGSIQQISGYFENNWYILLPNMLVTMFGSFILYILLAGRGIVTVGDALSTALVLFLPYLSASIIVGWASFAGFLLFLVPGLYLTGRLALLPAVLAHEPELGAMGAIRQAWHTSKGHAWSILVVLMFVALGVRVLSGIVMAIVAAIAIAVAGEGGVPVINAVVTAIFAAIEAVAYVLLTVAIHRQLASRE